MNNSIFLRLVWKEYRLQRAFWISMVVLAALFCAIVLWAARESEPEFRTIWLFDVALVLSALYALGCGATLFATEHEAGTYDFQRALPVSWHQFFFAKVTFAVASTLAMIGLLSSLAAILAGFPLPDPQSQLELWAFWGPAVLEALLWGMFFSLLLARPLKAAVLAGVAVSVSAGFAWVICLEAGARHHHQPYLHLMGVRAVLISIIPVVTIWLGYRWFRERLIPLPQVGLPRTHRKFTDEAARTLLDLTPTKGSVLGRLVWQHFRQSAGMLAVLTALVVPLFLTAVCLCVYVFGWMEPGEPSWHLWSGRWAGVVGLTAWVSVALAGGCTFLGDQRRRGFRFLAERGVRPGHVWLTRHSVWAGAVLFWTAFTLPFYLLAVARHFPSLHGLASSAGLVLGLVILAYAAGQLSSMFVSSGILAGTFSVMLAALLYCWAGLMAVLDVPWLWSVAPIPLALLLATWLRTPHWLLERNTLRAWLPTVLALAVPTVAIATSVCMYRVYSVPYADPGFDPQEYAKPATSEARATADMYRRAMDLYVSPPRKQGEDGHLRSPSSRPGSPLTSAETAWLNENQDAIRLTIEATRRTACDFCARSGRTDVNRHVSGFDAADDYYGWSGWASSGQLVLSFDALGDLLVTSARLLESEGDLDAALQRYLAALRLSVHLRQGTRSPRAADRVERRVYDCLPFWATRADQTAASVRTAIKEVEKLQQNVPSSTGAIKSDHVLVERVLAGDLDPVEVIEFDRLLPTSTWGVIAAQWLPWERARTRRALNLFTRRQLELLDEVESSVRGNRTCDLPDDPNYDRDWHALERTTWLLNVFSRPRGCYMLAGQQGYTHYDSPRGYFLACDFVRMETRRRAVRLQLALAGWRIEHGQLPGRLDELAGPFLERVPLDPYTAQPFQYFPEGTSALTFNQGLNGRDMPQETLVSSDKPFFQSAGRLRRPRFGSDRDFVFPIPVGQ